MLHSPQGTPVAELLPMLIQEIHYEEHLRHSDDFATRWENVQELINFASSADAAHHGRTDVTPLRAFLESSSLATDATQPRDATPQVTISTCHAAKGLEWPIVFLPASEDGSYPLYRCTTPEEIREERRLYYVAMTRAQTHLYLTHAERRRMAGEWGTRSVSPYLAPLLPKERGGTLARGAMPVPWSFEAPPINHASLSTVAAILGRPALSEASVETHVRALYVCLTYPAPNRPFHAASPCRPKSAPCRAMGPGQRRPSALSLRCIRSMVLLPAALRQVVRCVGVPRLARGRAPWD